MPIFHAYSGCCIFSCWVSFDHSFDHICILGQQLDVFAFPRKYVVSSPLIAYYLTQMIGDARKPPTLLASPDFAGMAVIGKCHV
jgi:hypothetical protein